MKVARSETPGSQITRSSPVSFAGRLDRAPAVKAIQSSGWKPDWVLEQAHPGLHPGLFSTVPQTPRHFS